MFLIEIDIVFANSTCFNYDMIKRISELGEKMSRNSLLVTLTYPLPNALESYVVRDSSGEIIQQKVFEIVMQRNYPMSWGVATAFFHRKL